MIRKATAGLIIGIGVLAACSVTTNFDGYTPSDVSCDSVRLPERPNEGSGGIQTVYGVTRGLHFTEPGGTTPGLDLDGLCTCPQPGSCVAPPRADSCDDGSRGVDNKGSALLGALFENEQALQQGLAHGQHGLFVRLDRYNGQPNDPEVIASIYNVVGVTEKTDGTATARFDGSDFFIVDSDSIISDGEMKSRFFDEKAYVRDGVLVATLSNFDLRLMIQPRDNSAPVPIIEKIASVQLVGRIQSDSTGLRIENAVLAGRIPLSTMFLNVGPASVCAGGNVFSTIKGSVCAALDLNADPQAPASAPCNALSFAVLLDIVPAQLRNGAKPASIKADPCPPTEIRCD